MPDQVERFKHSEAEWAPWSDPDGEWVRYSDYESTIDALRRAIVDSEELTEVTRGALATARDERDQAREQERERVLKALGGNEMKQIATDALLEGTPNNHKRSGKFGEGAITSNQGIAETGGERVMEAAVAALRFLDS